MSTNALLLWLSVSVIFAIGELVVPTFTLLWFSMGALITMFSSLFIKNLLWQTTIFLFTSVLILVIGTKYLVNRDKDVKYDTNLQGLISCKGIVLKDINPYEVGIVKLKGEDWSAISNDNSVIVSGKPVEVLKIEGVKLVVKEVETNEKE